MAVVQIVFFFVSTVLVFSESYYVTPFRKCHSRDSDCLRNYFQTVVWEAAENGIPQLGIPVLDPVVIKNYHTSAPGWIDLELVEAVGEGMRSCVITQFWLNLDKRYGYVEVICDVSVNGHYKIYSNSTLIRNFLNGDTIYGDGTGGISLEKVKISYDFNIDVVNRGPENYLNCNFENSKFGIDILHRATFAASSLYLGQLEASETIVALMNSYWKMVLDATGVPVMDGLFKFLFDFTQKYLNSVPLSAYLIDSVEPYVFG